MQQPRATADAWSIMLYTSGTTAQPKGVPRRQQRRTRRAALAHVAQNMYANGERTLGVMPLYHTMGVRSLLAMSLIGGTFVCLPRFDVQQALALIAAEKISNLYLVPTLYHDLVHHERFAAADVRSVRKLGFAGAPMTDGLLKELQAAFEPEPVRQSLRLVGNLHLHYRPERACKARLCRARRHQSDACASLNSALLRPTRSPPPERKARSSRSSSSDEAFEGYWRRPEADAEAIRQGWYFTGDTGYFDADGDLFVTGRVDDMIITGGENVSPVEIESCLSLHPAVSEVAVVGLAGRALGQDRRRLRQAPRRCRPSRTRSVLPHLGSRQLQAPAPLFVRARDPEIAGRASSLRRKLVAGEYELESAPPLARQWNRMHDDHDFVRPTPRRTRRLPRRDRCRARARRYHPRPAAVQHHRDAAARSACGWCSRRSTRTRAYASSCCAQSASISPAAATSRVSWRRRLSTCRSFAWNIAAPARCRKPVIAANRGYCFGVGFEISLACDFRIASETCFYALPEQKLGQIPGSGGSARLQKIIGITRTKDIVMRSKRIQRQAGLRMGHRNRMRAGWQARSCDRRSWLKSCAHSRRSRSAPPKSCLNDTEDATPLHGN